MNIVEAMRDDALFGRFFRGPSWDAWKTWLRAAFALEPRDERDVQLYTQCTGRTQWPTEPSTELWLAKGRRGGGTRVGSFVLAYLAALRDYRSVLGAGEVGTAAIISRGRRNEAHQG